MGTQHFFEDRGQAGRFLADELLSYKDEPGIILAIPRGGIPIAYEVAKKLNFPVEILLIKKIGHPLNKEYAIGTASLNDYYIIPVLDVSSAYIKNELKSIRTTLEHMQDLFLGSKQPTDLKGKTVILIDDGMATGHTILGTVNIIKKSNPGKIIVAIPVASIDAVEKLSKKVDKVVALIVPEEFGAVGAFYENFDQVSENDVQVYLNKLRVCHLY
ncbi:MAG: phosphoribosyltransferase family protein [Candidatus Pedobacter colombiensis]|uniref:Phosphoribosyltransferase family protein n=1 Tax=Candidatus Pedobacter colombiensis TaxID=3121371 RepID=A0AAJ6BA99_9SPHI|nr:phosphoribosyltransferase family protein [Pedobacter sp.]WEK21048.1 MAG: phosphoribosyltransferase family protein [Pedobacter sp.]